MMPSPPVFHKWGIQAAIPSLLFWLNLLVNSINSAEEYSGTVVLGPVGISSQLSPGSLVA